MSVYFAQVGDYMKIGYSTDPIARVAYLTYMECRPAEVENGDSVDLIGWFPGGVAEEKKAHERFADHHVIGEWFSAEPAMAEYLEAQDEAVLMEGLTFAALALIREGMPPAEARAMFPARPESELIANLFGGLDFGGAS